VSLLIDPPPRIARSRATALTSYFLLDTGPYETRPNRWANGVSFVGYGCDTEVHPSATDPCAESEEKEDPQGFTEPAEFPPFVFYLNLQCTALSMTPAELHKHLDVLTASELSPIFAEQVMNGVWNSAAPSLMSEATVVSQTGMASPHAAVGAVEDGLADLWRGAVGMIHVPPSVLVQIVDMLVFEDGRFVTPSGHIVVADAGYQAGSPGSGVSTAGEAWVYGSSPVHYRYVTPDWNGYDFEQFDFTRDIQTVRVEGVGIAVFEPCSVVAARVDYTP
jgi:hypothetical protein